jgi:hypothetical protein
MTALHTGILILELCLRRRRKLRRSKHADVPRSRTTKNTTSFTQASRATAALSHPPPNSSTFTSNHSASPCPNSQESLGLSPRKHILPTNAIETLQSMHGAEAISMLRTSLSPESLGLDMDVFADLQTARATVANAVAQMQAALREELGEESLTIYAVLGRGTLVTVFHGALSTCMHSHAIGAQGQPMAGKLRVCLGVMVQIPLVLLIALRGIVASMI